MLLWGIVVFIISIAGAYADALPSAPLGLEVGLNTTYNPENRGIVSIEAIAGNITALVLTGLGQTKAWQGYYGNITGTITLDDADNFTFYNWSSAEPQGQIYATLNNSIAWYHVECYDFVTDTLNWNVIEGFYNIQTDDVDGVNETYNQTDHPVFTVADQNMTGCPTTYIYQNDVYQQANFANVLLWDMTNNDTGWIYTTLIEDKATGTFSDFVCYNNQLCDFQLLVNENGHGSDTALTTYYFWVELT